MTEREEQKIRPTVDEETAILKEAIQIVRAHANMERIRMAQGHNSSDYDAARNAFDVELIAAYRRHRPSSGVSREAETIRVAIRDRWRDGCARHCCKEKDIDLSCSCGELAMLLARALNPEGVDESKGE